MGADTNDYHPSSVDAVLSRIETKIDQHGDKLDRIEVGLSGHEGRIVSLETDRAEVKTVARYGWKFAVALCSVVSAVGGWLAHVFHTVK